jgi:hypothetical protein
MAPQWGSSAIKVVARQKSFIFELGCSTMNTFRPFASDKRLFSIRFLCKVHNSGDQ